MPFKPMKFTLDKAELKRRIAKVNALESSPAFQDAIERFLASLHSHAVDESDAPKLRDEAAPRDILAAIEAVRGLEVPYDWYVANQGSGTFAATLASEATDRTGKGRFWSKLQIRRSVKAANGNNGVLLESCIGGVLFNGFDWGRSSWGWSPTLGLLWDLLSETYADHLHGTVEADVLDGIHDRSVLTVTEWERLKLSLLNGKVSEFFVNIYKFEGNQFTRTEQIKITGANMGAWDQIARVGTDKVWNERQAQIDTHEKLMHRLDEFLSEFPEAVLNGDESPKVEELVVMLDPNSLLARNVASPRQRSNAMIPRMVKITWHRA